MPLLLAVGAPPPLLTSEAFAEFPAVSQVEIDGDEPFRIGVSKIIALGVGAGADAQ
jgi:hypothetical protein